MFTQFEIIASPPAYLLLALFAVALGSFLNVVIYRTPRRLRSQWLQECRTTLALPEEPVETLNVCRPRSFCPACKTPILARHNVPILSYLVLRGRCKTCKHSISLRYPLVEITSVLLACLSFNHFGFNATFLASLVCISFLIALFFIDLEHQLLPDQLTLTLLWLGLIANTENLFTSLPNAVIGAVVGYCALWFFIKLFYWITGKIGMGNGDFKLVAAFGAWFGWAQLPFILLIASIMGVIVGISYLKIQKKTRDTPIPFGPFLCIAGILSLFGVCG